MLGELIECFFIQKLKLVQELILGFEYNFV